MPHELVRREWLSEHRTHPVPGRFPHDDFVAISRDEHHGQLRPLALEHRRELEPVENRHPDVGHDEIETALAPPDQVQRALTVLRLQRTVACFLEGPRDHPAHQRIVFHHQRDDVPHRLRDRWVDRRGRLGGCRFEREEELEPRAAARLAFHADGAAELVHDPMHHRKAQPRALADALGGEERLERALQCRPLHSVAAVLDREQREPAGGGPSSRRGMPPATTTSLVATVTRPPLGHGIPGIEHRFSRAWSSCRNRL